MGGQKTRVTKIGIMKVEAATDACLVQIYGPGLGKRWPVEGVELVAGRDLENDIVVELDNVSRRHCRFFTRGNEVRVADLGSTNGTWLNGEEVQGEVELASGDLVKVGGAIFKFLTGDNVESLYHEEIYQATIVDGLTQAFNKRYLLDFLEREMERSRRHGGALSLLMMDVDHFKRVNDAHGHLAGDKVLRELAGLIRARVRREECFARYGGEEFSAVLPESELQKALTFARKLLELISGHRFEFDSQVIPVTISIGVATMSARHVGPDDFIREADEQLLRAKREGRNRVCHPGEPSGTGG